MGKNKFNYFNLLSGIFKESFKENRMVNMSRGAKAAEGASAEPGEVKKKVVKEIPRIVKEKAAEITERLNEIERLLKANSIPLIVDRGSTQVFDDEDRLTVFIVDIVGDRKQIVLQIEDDPEDGFVLYVDGERVSDDGNLVEKIKNIAEGKGVKIDRGPGKKKETRAKLAGLKKKFKADELQERAKAGLNKLRASMKRREFSIDTNAWQPTTEGGIKHMTKGLKQVGVDLDSVAWVEGEFLNAMWKANESDNSVMRVFFENPEANGGPRVEDFTKYYPEGGEGFYYAYMFYKETKEWLAGTQDQANLYNKKLAERDEVPLFTSVVNKGSEIFGDVMTAVQEGDVAKMALYGTAALAFTKFYQNVLSPWMNKKGEGGSGGKKNVLIWGATALCAALILKPDLVKQALGKGVHGDIKGTAIETLSGILESNPAIGKSAIHKMALLSVSKARVQDVYRQIIPGSGGFNAVAADQGMVNLFQGGLQPYFRDQLRLTHHVNPKTHRGQMSADEKLYVEYSKALYEAAWALKNNWDEKILVQGDTKQEGKFEDRFLGPTADPNLQMQDFYNVLADYNSHFTELPWDESALTEVEKMLRGPAGGEGLFTDFHNVEDITIVGGGVSARIMGFPVLIERDTDNKSRKTRLKIRLAGDVPPIATYVDGTPKDTVRMKVEEGIRKRMDVLLSDLTVEGAEARAGHPFEYGDGKWTGEFDRGTLKNKRLAKVISGGKATYKAEVYPDGQAVKCTSEKSDATIVIDKTMREYGNYSNEILANVVNQDGFEALKPLYLARKIKLKDVKDANSNFELLFPGGLSLEVRLGSNGIYRSLDRAKETKLVQSELFRRAYVDAFAEQEFGFFDKMKEHVDKMPQSYFFYFPESATKWFSGFKFSPDSDAISGSIPNYFTYMLIDSKKDALKYRLFWKMKASTTLGGVKTAKQAIEDQLIEMKRFASGAFLQAMKGKDSGSWSRDEFMMKVVEPFRQAGVSRTYLSAINNFENLVFKKIGYKGERGGDLSAKAHARAGQLSSAFYYYTAEHDAEFTDNSTDQIRFENYCDYVGRELCDQYEESSSPSLNIPPESFEIKRFAEWKDVNPDSDKLKGIDAQGELSETKIREKLVEAYEEVVDTMTGNYGSNLKFTRLQAKMAKYKESGKRFDTHSKHIHDVTGRRRSRQLEMIQDYKMAFIEELYRDDGLWVDLSLREKWDDFVRKVWA